MMDTIGTFMDANAGLHRKLDALRVVLSIQAAALTFAIIVGAWILHRKGIVK